LREAKFCSVYKNKSGFIKLKEGKMKLELEREKIIKYGRKLVESGLTKGTGGNLSIYNPEEGLMAISPSGIDYRI